MTLYVDKREALEPFVNHETDALQGKPRSLMRDAMRRFRSNKAAMLSLAVLLLIVLAAVIGPGSFPSTTRRRTGPPSAPRPRSRPGTISAPTRTAATFSPARSTARASRFSSR